MQIGDIKKATIIGAGAMGHGIAQALAIAGYTVTMTDVQQSFLDNGIEKVKKNLDFLVGKGKLAADAKDNILSNLLKTSLDLKAAVSDSQLVIEAAPEIMDLKKKIFSDVASSAPADAILATNTSTMSISEIGSAVSNPQRFLGMHFFNPADRMKLVEVILGEQSDPQCADLLSEVVLKMKKVPIKVLKDRPGFIVNRISAPNQAFISAMLDEGKISTDAVDNVMKKMGQPMGPFELVDFVGVDVFCHTLDYYSKTLSPEFKPGAYLTDKLEKKELGAKTGQGIYKWVDGKAQIDASKETNEVSPMDFLAIQINEAVRVFKEGIAQSTEDIDQAVVHGMRAFAGPFAICAGVNPPDLVAALKKLKDRYGLQIFEPEPEIVDGSFKTLKR